MARRPRFRRRRFLLPRRLFKACLLLAGLWLAGFLAFTGWVMSATPPNPMPHADGIVALTGGDERVGAALALLADHDAPVLLISGVAHGTYLGDLTQDDSAAATRYASAIKLGHDASNTHTNASETADWVKKHHMKSLIVVTADYHMPRALLEIGKALPGVALIAAPVRPPAMNNLLSWPTMRLLAEEYSKYVVVRLGFGPLAGQLIGDDE